MSEKILSANRGDSLPEPVANAIMTTAGYLRRKEAWVPPVRGAVMLGMPRLIGIAVASVSDLDPESASAQAVRQGILRILAYLSADIRVMVLIRIASQDPKALDDVLTGKIDQDHRAYRYNVMTSLGVFARHGLINEVMTSDRVERVTNSLERVRAKLSGNT
jgi:hypothetical protein